MNEDSYDEEAEDYGILKKALHVELPEDFNPNKVPQTGEEYLQHVIYERKNKCKSWVTANIDRSKFQEQTFKIELNCVKKASSTLLPSQEWQLRKIEEFTKFRKFVQSKIAKEPIVSIFDEENFLEKIHQEDPQFSDVVSYSQAGKIRMLQIISKQLDNVDERPEFVLQVGPWVYAILTLLEKPLSPDSCHTLREFAKRCIGLRTNLDEISDLHQPLNLFICIVSRFYNQLDLAD